MTRFFSFACFLAFSGPLLAYGPIGHETVGAVADELLKDRPVAKKIAALTDGITLRRASNMPDEIKAWDKKGVDDPKAFPHYHEHEKIDADLREFWRANPPSHDPNAPAPSHHWFHYTDVPVMTVKKYADGKAGRNQYDIVHMIPYCVSVLRGEIPDNNPRKITKSLAVILLAHYVGDIHQPLHVGAEYFTNEGEPVDPDSNSNAIADQGGNTLSWNENATAQHPGHHYHSLHGFWDLDAVRTLVIGTPDEVPKQGRESIYGPAKEKLLVDLTTHEPKGWRTKGDVKTWAMRWADEILPVAREAHTRLQFQGVHREEKDGEVFAKGRAQEIGTGYREWAAQTVHDEIHKAGWRLAALLEEAIESKLGTSLAPAAASAAQPNVSATPQPTNTPEDLSTPPKNATSVPSSQAAAVAAPSIAVSPPPPPSPYGTYPANYKEIVSAWVGAKGIDAAKLDWQSEPKPAVLPDATGCQVTGYLVIFNSGTKTRSVLIKDGAVISANGF